MDVGTPIPVEEYLSTSYHPDCDYVDGQVCERNWGERDHSTVQVSLGSWLHVRRHELGIHVFPELRFQVAPRRYRIPDLAIVHGGQPKGKILTQAPLICVEILSSEDRIGRMQEKINDYLKAGVSYIWLIDPESRRVWVYMIGSVHEVEDGFLHVPELSIACPLSGIFADLA